MSKMTDNLIDMNSAHINLSMLRVLAAVADTGSFSLAADRLGLTQSAVSHAVRGLEQAAGLQLLLRGRRGITTTAAGDAALAAARTALAAVDDIARLGQAPVEGVVRLALVASASVRIAPAVLTRARAWPALNLRLLVGTDAEVSAWVANGVADLGLAFGDEQGEVVLDDRFYAIATRQGGSVPASPGDFAGLPFIMPASGCEPMIRRILGTAGVAPDVVLTAHDTATLFALVGAGHGVALVPGLCFPAGWEATIARRDLGPEADQPLRLIGATGSAAGAVVAGLIRQAASEAAVSLAARPGPEGSPLRSPLRDRPISAGIPATSSSVQRPRGRRTTAR